VIYKILTFLIIVLGKIRRRVAGYKMELVKDSPLMAEDMAFEQLEDRGFLIRCCDCGLEHRLFRHRVLSPFPERQSDVLKAWPLRAIGYDYSWRG